MSEFNQSILEKILKGSEAKEEMKKVRQSFDKFIMETQTVAFGEVRPEVTCKDGYSISVQASSFHYSYPREDGLTSYEEFEVKGLTEGRIERLKEWAEDYENVNTVYGFVPKEEILQLILEHGGLDEDIIMKRVRERKEVFKPKEDNQLEAYIQEASGGNEFIANILRYATRNVKLNNQNEVVQKLTTEYENVVDGNIQGIER